MGEWAITHVTHRQKGDCSNYDALTTSTFTHTDFRRFFGELQEWAKKTRQPTPTARQSPLEIWRNKLPRRHRITLISDKPEMIIQASFPRVVFEDIPLEELALDLAMNFKGTGIQFIHDRLVKID